MQNRFLFILKMELFFYILTVVPVVVNTITILPNGNSPEVKMVGGMMVDVQKGFVPFTPKELDVNITKSNEETSKNNLISTKLSINERYRRLIPYMTFYYANDLASTTTKPYIAKDIEVEKAHIVEAQIPPRTAKKIVQSPYRNIPRYQGNRLTHYNIASSIPTKIIKEAIPSYHYPQKLTPNYNPLVIDPKFTHSHINRFPQKSNIKIYEARKPTVNLYQSDDNSNVRYYYSEKDPTQKFKLIPYDQTPPVQVTDNINVYDTPNRPQNAQILIPNEQVYLKPRTVRPQYIYETAFPPQTNIRKPPATISENYYEKINTGNYEFKTQPIVETGFKPIVPVAAISTTENPVYVNPETDRPGYKSQPVVFETASVAPEHEYTKPNYYQYVVDEPPKSPDYVSRDSSTLSDILSMLQKSKSIPKPITRDNIGSSIRTLLQVLNTLKAAPDYGEIEVPVLSTPKPFVASPEIVKVNRKPEVEADIPTETEFGQEPYLAPVNPPSQHLDIPDYSISGGSSSQRFPLPIRSDDDGGTPGRAGIDYPTLTIIPQTEFDCKTQRYKGFFADPETRCQVWHYCDLNGGQASFLCPNGTIFSQAGLTCDWWFNVRCASTAQLYVLNESLYKYILPHSPKFPEDYSGPLVDKYLTLKFKEMEDQFRKNKNKQNVSEKMDSEVKDSREETTTEMNEMDASSETNNVSGVSAVSEASVVVQSPGNSGNVERLHD